MNKMVVRGVAVKAGVSRNGILYTTEELEKFAPTLKGRPMLKDHNAMTDNTIGLVEDSTYSEEKVYYNGWVKDAATNERIADGRIKEVSIGAVAGRLVKESEDSDVLIAKDMVAMELSTTPCPGVVGTSITQALKQIGEAETAEEKAGVLPIMESVDTIKEFDSSNESKEVNKMVKSEIKEEEQPQEEEKAEEEQPEEEAKEEEKTEEKVQALKVDIDTSKLDEALMKMEKLKQLKEEIAEGEEEKPEEKPAEPEAEAPAEPEKEKGEVASGEEAEGGDVGEGYVVESNEDGEGYCFWKKPKAEGE